MILDDKIVKELDKMHDIYNIIQTIPEIDPDSIIYLTGDENARLYTGTVLKDGTEVVMKVYTEKLLEDLIGHFNINNTQNGDILHPALEDLLKVRLPKEIRDNVPCAMKICDDLSRKNIITAEKIEGINIYELIKDRQKLDVLCAHSFLYLIEKIAQSLAEFHQAKLIHQGINNKNFMLDFKITNQQKKKVEWPPHPFDSFEVKLIDFDLSYYKHDDWQVDNYRYLVNSTYAADEVHFRAGVYEPESEVFSLGRVMYKIFTGRNLIDRLAYSRAFFKLIKEEEMPTQNAIETYLDEGVFIAWVSSRMRNERITPIEKENELLNYKFDKTTLHRINYLIMRTQRSNFKKRPSSQEVYEEIKEIRESLPKP